MKITSFTGPDRFLSNFWPCVITYEGLVFGSVEAAYQAAKCVNAVDMIPFQGYSPAEAKRAGRRVEMLPHFDTVKVSIMSVLLSLKFASHTPLADKLLATGDAYLEEGNTWGDRFWGVCGGVGENYLGRLLMARRAVLMEVVEIQ